MTIYAKAEGEVEPTMLEALPAPLILKNMLAIREVDEVIHVQEDIVVYGTFKLITQPFQSQRHSRIRCLYLVFVPSYRDSR